MLTDIISRCWLDNFLNVPRIAERRDIVDFVQPRQMTAKTNVFADRRSCPSRPTLRDGQDLWSAKTFVLARHAARRMSISPCRHRPSHRLQMSSASLDSTAELWNDSPAVYCVKCCRYFVVLLRRPNTNLNANTNLNPNPINEYNIHNK